MRKLDTMKNIYTNIEQWETGKLGNTEEHAKVSNFTIADLQQSIELQAISLRVNKDLLNDLKELAKLYGIGYQPLMKQILRRFVDTEKRRLANEFISQINHSHLQEENEFIEEPLRKVG